jgi:hypothetical protein
MVNRIEFKISVCDVIYNDTEVIDSRKKTSVNTSVRIVGLRTHFRNSDPRV